MYSFEIEHPPSSASVGHRPPSNKSQPQQFTPRNSTGSNSHRTTAPKSTSLRSGVIGSPNSAGSSLKGEVGVGLVNNHRPEDCELYGYSGIPCVRYVSLMSALVLFIAMFTRYYPLYHLLSVIKNLLKIVNQINQILINSGATQRQKVRLVKRSSPSVKKCRLGVGVLPT